MHDSHANGISLAEAADLLPRKNGKKRHVCTIKRWIVKGCRGVKLYGWRSGNDWYTTPDAIRQFERECTRHSGTAVIRQPAEQSQAVAQARATLRRNGFYGRDERSAKTQEVLGARLQEAR
jgi:hypothetical protein